MFAIKWNVNVKKNEILLGILSNLPSIENIKWIMKYEEENTVGGTLPYLESNWT